MTSTDNTLELIALREGMTPGPWVVRTLENFGFNVVHYKNGDKFDMVRVAKCGDEANSKAIAALPDLLDRLASYHTLAIAAGYPEGVEAALKAIPAKDEALAMYRAQQVNVVPSKGPTA